MKNLMIDIETLGTTPGSVILSISAVLFEDDGTLGEEFDVNIDLASCIDAGLKMDASTVLWWMKQSDEARSQFTDERKRHSINQALGWFWQWYNKHAKDVKIFAKDPDFDCSILEDAYRLTMLHCPFGHRGKMAIRTLSTLRPEFEKNEEFTGVKHNGLDDCKHQIKYVVKILNDIK